MLRNVYSAVYMNSNLSRTIQSTQVNCECDIPAFCYRQTRNPLSSCHFVCGHILGDEKLSCDFKLTVAVINSIECIPALFVYEVQQQTGEVFKSFHGDIASAYQESRRLIPKLAQRQQEVLIDEIDVMDHKHLRIIDDIVRLLNIINSISRERSSEHESLSWKKKTKFYFDLAFDQMYLKKLDWYTFIDNQNDQKQVLESYLSHFINI